MVIGCVINMIFKSVIPCFLFCGLAFTYAATAATDQESSPNQLLTNRNITSLIDCSSGGVCESKPTELSSTTQESTVTVSGTVNYTPLEGATLQVNSSLNVTRLSKQKCPDLEGADSLTQTQLINRLTAPCRYDRLERPNIGNSNNGSSTAVEVHVRIFIYVLQNVQSSDLQLKMYGLLQMRYMDPRLAFGKYAPSRNQPLLGEARLREQIWVPHLFLTNEHDSSVLGTNEKDILTSISPDGTVVISSRIKATLYCWMNLVKFPFDEQFCTTLLESWMYNTSQLVLHWEHNSPIAFDPKLHLTEYSLVNAWCNESIVVADDFNMQHGAFAGSYSSLNFTVYLVRESGYYIMDYFLPSIMIVAISWVSFWLQADQTPARTTLGTSTMLSFITLASSQDANLPKVSYIKISEIWFLGCTLFIFSSLVEFAFVNTIWRRKRNVELKKVNSKYILKSTLTPRCKSSLSRENCSSFASSSNSLDVVECCTNSESNDDTTRHQTWSTMTPQEVSLWIDRKSRFVFPLAFLIFNAIFWLLVYCL